MRVLFFLLAFMAPLLSWAQDDGKTAQDDGKTAQDAKTVSQVAAQLGALEIAKISLAVQLEAAQAEIARLKKEMGK
jgi:hypothetical protein